MGRRLESFAILILLLNIESSLGFDCIAECFSPLSDLPDANLTCELLQGALDCYDDNIETCNPGDEFILGFQVQNTRNELRNQNCELEPATTASASPSPVVTCPNVPSQTMNQLPAPDIVPEGRIPSQCLRSGTAAVSHCSLFVHSHLRPFHFADNANANIQTCSLPGAWYLVRHQNLTIEVEGTVQEATSMHTQLTKVTVIFPSSADDCNPMRRSYVASNTVPLPQDFACSEDDAHNNTDSPLQLHASEDLSVVTLTATWLNSTVIIRKMAGYLAVTVKVTGQLAFESDGLCSTRCPANQYVASRSFYNNIDLMQNCQAERNTAVINCFFLPILSDRRLLDVENISYVDACIYSMLKADSSSLSMLMDALGQDALLVPNYGTVPMRPQVLPVGPIRRPEAEGSISLPPECDNRDTTTTTTTMVAMTTDTSLQQPSSTQEDVEAGPSPQDATTVASRDMITDAVFSSAVAISIPLMTRVAVAGIHYLLSIM